MISVQRISENDFAAMRVEWNALLAHSRNPGPMLTWEWMFSWWEAYRQSDVTRELHLLAARLPDGRLAGLVPFILRPAKRCGLRFRRLEFMGTGEAERDETCSEYLDWIVDLEHEDACVEAFTHELLGDAGWDEIVCRDIRTDRPSTVARFREAAARPDGLRVEEFGAARCPFIPLPASWEAYLDGLSRNSRRLVRYKRKQLLAAARVEVQSIRDTDEILKVYNRFMDLHQVRWSAQEKDGCFASKVFSGFLRRVTERLAPAGGVQIALLSANGEAIAMYLLLRHGERLYYYNSGMATGVYEEHSPGSVCLGYLIEQAIRDGDREVHLFKGGPTSYKYHWTDRVVPVGSFRVERRGLKLAACRLLARAEGIARRAVRGSR
jgi:CelD/BcsL family acetyltransferase involved in cellulose biosynthesis